MRTTQTHVQERVVPTHLFGFVLSPNEFELTQSTGFHLGWDQRIFGGKTFVRTVTFWKDRVVLTYIEVVNRMLVDGDLENPVRNENRQYVMSLPISWLYEKGQ